MMMIMNNRHFSEVAPHHGWHRYGMKKLRQCHPMHSNCISAVRTALSC